MKVGHFVSLGIGGADRAAYNLAMGLKSLGTPPLIFYSSNSLPSRTPDQDPNLPLLDILSFYKKDFETHLIGEVGDLNAFGLDILHTHRSGEDEWLLPGLEGLERTFKIVETNFHGKLKTPADFRIYPSKALMRWNRIKASNNNAVIPNAILPPLSTSSFRSQLNIEEGTVILGRLARADDSVFSPSLLKAYKALKRNLDVALVWVGASEQAKGAATKIGLEDIFWVDPVKDPMEVSTWMNTFDVFCHFNKLGETFGNTVAEAMFHSLPVVSLRGSLFYPQAQRELLRDGQQYLHTRAAATNRLRNLVTNANFRLEVGSMNRTKAFRDFLPKSVAVDIANIYSGLMTTRLI
jgi:glycosyltransferase involved in cell wall biosynthesis